MPRYYGNIGFAVTEETRPGIWEETITEKPYYGDILSNSRNLQTREHINDDVMINNSFSIVADPYATENMYAMRYLTWNGAKWKITTINVEYPRLMLTVGGIYNEE